MKFKFFPEDYELDDKLSKWTKAKGLTDNQIAEQLEYIKTHEFNPMRSCPRRTWQKWVLNSIRYGHVVPVVTREYRRPEVDTETAEEKDRKFKQDLRQRFKVVK